ncbi:MAG: hypothetical protein Kapaf2KO_02380 [Candidatus Kapaibacteriales bacterium]
MGKLAAPKVFFELRYDEGAKYYSHHGQESQSQLADLSQKKGFTLRSFTLTDEINCNFWIKKLNNQELTLSENRYCELIFSLTLGAYNSLVLRSELKDETIRLQKNNLLLRNLFTINRDFSRLLNFDGIDRLFSLYLMGHLRISSFYLFVLLENDELIRLDRIKTKKNISTSKIEAFFYSIPEFKETASSQSDLQEIPFKIGELELTAYPTYIDGKKRAVLLLGNKLEGKSPETSFGISAHKIDSSNDRQYIESLCLTAVTAYENASLFEERLRLQSIEGELHLAKKIQRDLLPNTISQPQGYAIAARNISAKHVGGDYYDVIVDKNGFYNIIIADVSGKGIPASLIMANIQSAVRLLVGLGFRLETVVEDLNVLLTGNISSDKFVSMCLSVLKPEASLLKNCTVGHPPPIHIWPDSRGLYCKENSEFLQKGGMVLGVLMDYKDYQSEYINLKKGSVVIYYTDGYTDGDIKGTSGQELLFEYIIKTLNILLSSETNGISDFDAINDVKIASKSSKMTDEKQDMVSNTASKLTNELLIQMIEMVSESMSAIEEILPDDMTMLAFAKQS